MMKRLIILLGALVFSPALVHAAPYPVIAQDVGVCDPNAPTHCVAPNSSGQMPVTGSFTPSGTQDVNLKQVGATTVLTGAGATGTGSERVTIAQDSTTVAGSASLPAGTNVIGHVITDTTSTTAVTQATASNLNAQVQGTVADGVAANGNPNLIGGVFTTASTLHTTGQIAQIHTDAQGNPRVVLCGPGANGTDAAATCGTLGVFSDATGPNIGLNVYNYTHLIGASNVWAWSRSIDGAQAGGLGTTAVHTAPTTAITASTTSGQCTVACASLIVSGAHNIYGAGWSSTATGWLLLEDATSCAANGTITPLRAYAYPTANVTQTLSWGDVPRSVATGMAWCFSTTGPFTATASTTAFIYADYK